MNHGVDLIFETDIGHDIDDFCALCYLIEAGVNINLVTICPGSPRQVAIAKFILDMCGFTDVPVGVGKLDLRKITECNDAHAKILKKYGYPLEAEHDGYGPELISEINSVEDCEFFIGGPLMSVGPYFGCTQPVTLFRKCTMQGGYISYEDIEKVANSPKMKVDKFIGKSKVPTFNLGGCPSGGDMFLKAPITQRRFVSKNLCHTFLYDNDVHIKMMNSTPKTPAGQLLREIMHIYMQKRKHRDGGKKFHDILAAVAHLHDDALLWTSGFLHRERGQWGTDVGPFLDREKYDTNCMISIDYNWSLDKIWKRVIEGE